MAFSVVGVDPTFNLGDFSVTPIVFQHLMLTHRKTGRSPWLLGPMLIHYRKEFFSALLGLRQQLGNIRAIGTDGEISLIEAAGQQFQHAIHLRCFRHLQKNIESHLSTSRLTPSVIQEFIKDIFGWTGGDDSHKEGLVDSNDPSEFFSNLEALRRVWDNRESDAMGGGGGGNMLTSRLSTNGLYRKKQMYSVAAP